MKNAPYDNQARCNLHGCRDRTCANEAYDSMDDFKQRQRLNSLQERKQSIVETVELVMRDKGRNEEDCSEDDRGPEAEADSVVC